MTGFRHHIHLRVDALERLEGRVVTHPVTIILHFHPVAGESPSWRSFHTVGRDNDRGWHTARQQRPQPHLIVCHVSTGGAHLHTKILRPLGVAAKTPGGVIPHLMARRTQQRRQQRRLVRIIPAAFIISQRRPLFAAMIVRETDVVAHPKENPRHIMAQARRQLADLRCDRVRLIRWHAGTFPFLRRRRRARRSLRINRHRLHQRRNKDLPARHLLTKHTTRQHRHHHSTAENSQNIRLHGNQRSWIVVCSD
jgi:hypothetical protein